MGASISVTNTSGFVCVIYLDGSCGKESRIAIANGATKHIYRPLHTDVIDIQLARAVEDDICTPLSMVCTNASHIDLLPSGVSIDEGRVLEWNDRESNLQLEMAALVEEEDDEKRPLCKTTADDKT